MTVLKMARMRLHSRTMVRDGRLAFVGSQSLRTVELDARPELGLIFRDPKLVARLHHTFTGDWALAEQAAEGTENHARATRVAKKVAKLVANDLPQVAPVLKWVAVKTAVKEVVSVMVEEAVEEDGGRPR